MAESIIRRLADLKYKPQTLTDFPWLPQDPGEAVNRIKQADALPKETRGKAMEAVENSIRELLAKQQDTGTVDPGVLSFYAAKGVPTDSLERLASGELPMDPASRKARAEAMGLDPKTVFVRTDWVGLDHPRQDYRGGLVYAGMSKDLADAAAQSRGQTYPLIGPKEVLGLQRVDKDILSKTITPEEYLEGLYAQKFPNGPRPWETYRSMQEWMDSYHALPEREGLERALKLQDRFNDLNELGSTGWVQSAQPVLRTRAEQAFDPKKEGNFGKNGHWNMRYRWAGDWQDAAPHWKLLEITRESGNNFLTPQQEFGSQLAHQRAKDAGAKGSLVGDEGGVSVAFFDGGKELRHADLSLLDPVHAKSPGYMRSLAPFLIGGAAAGTQQQR